MRFRLLLPLLVAMLLAGCGQQSSSTDAATVAGGGGPRVIEITAGDNMRFNVSRIEARAGEEITVVLTNIGAQPKEVMGHNWVLLQAGADSEAFDRAAAMARETDYIPASLKDQIIAHTGLLGPRKSGEVRFTAPDTPGDYPYLCSFPGHFQVGMKGTLVVR